MERCNGRWNQAMERNKTWIVVTLPKNSQAMRIKWVYKVKYTANGWVDRYKTRPMAKGYNQQEGIDFFDTFSPVAKFVIVKVLTLAITYNWPLTQMDINNAFLNGYLFEEVHMKLPLDYKTNQVPKEGEKLECKLNK